MNLRGKLVVYFSLLILAVLIVYGVSAYQISFDSAQAKETRLLESMVRHEATTFEKYYRKHGSLDEVIRHLDEYDADNHVWLLIDAGYSVLYPTQITPIFSGDMLRFPIKKLMKSDATSGFLEVGGQSYSWAVSELGDLGYRIFHVYKSDNSSQEPFAGLASRLFVAALLVLWVGVWIALVMSTAFSRRIGQQRQQLEYQATHDLVTGLPNRAYLSRKMERVINKGDTGCIAVIMLDIDRFGEINDTLGHAFGDEMLRYMGERLADGFWSRDAVARIGADEFVLMMPMKSKADADVVLEKIGKVLSAPLEIQGICLKPGFSMGMAVYPEDGQDLAILLKHAQIAMFSAKSSGSRYACYDADKDPGSVERLVLIGELLHAIERQELLLYFQPMVDAHSKELVAAEALIRWMNARRGVISPEGFIGLAEQGSVIKDITFWVLDNALRECAAWRDRGLEIKMAVNLSSRLLIDVELVAQVEQLLQKHGVNPRQLILEITEAAIMIDPERVAEIMRRLHEKGVQLSIDDFGTGYISISQLQQLPVHEVKIDKSFVINMLNDDGDAVIVDAIINLAHTMGCVVVAEGVETEAAMHALEAKGCDVIQGFYLGKPMPATEFEAAVAHLDRIRG